VHAARKKPIPGKDMFASETNKKRFAQQYGIHQAYLLAKLNQKDEAAICGIEERV